MKTLTDIARTIYEKNDTNLDKLADQLIEFEDFFENKSYELYKLRDEIKNNPEYIKQLHQRSEITDFDAFKSSLLLLVEDREAIKKTFIDVIKQTIIPLIEDQKYKAANILTKSRIHNFKLRIEADYNDFLSEFGADDPNY